MAIESKKNYYPYIVIAAAAIIAYLPVSFMVFALKNDVVVIEYPLQHFIGDSIHHGQLPVWFNSWAMGFPLQSVLSWSIYSTPQIILGGLFGSNFYLLHFQFILFIVLAGWGMYRLLKHHFLADEKISLLLACCFMLSGITVSSSQWLLYITCLSFLPWLIHAALDLIKKPSLRSSIALAIFYYLFFTNVHIYLSVVTTYILIVFIAAAVIYKFFFAGISQNEKSRLLKFVGLAVLFTALICFAPAYYTAELISYLNRAQPIAGSSYFFQANYFHPSALISLLTPLTSIKMDLPNTEGVVLNSYIGLFPLIVLPLSMVVIRKSKNFAAYGLFFLSVIFLVISFGHLTPLRAWLNILPGLSYFRHPGVLRIYFLLFFILYLASAFKNYSLDDLIIKNADRKIVRFTLYGLILVLLAAFILSISSFSDFKKSIYQTVKEISFGQAMLINSLVQLAILFFIALSLRRKNSIPYQFLVVDLVLNTLICLPYFTVSTYSVAEVDNILHSAKGYPVQTKSPSVVPAVIRDQKNNYWYNINTFSKEISSRPTMTGPLILKAVDIYMETDSLKNLVANKGILFSTSRNADEVAITKQRPNRIDADLSLTRPSTIILQQANFPGWKAYYNGKPIELNRNKIPFVNANIPAGKGKLILSFEKPGVWISALVIHLLVIIYFISGFYRRFKRKRRQ